MIGPSLVYVQETPVNRSDPQTAIAIPEQPSGLNCRARLEADTPRLSRQRAA